MAEMAANPRLVKHITFGLGVDSFSKHVKNVTITRSSTMQQWQGGTPDATWSEDTAPTYTVEVTGIQDWETAVSLCNYLLEHEGEQVPFTYMPQADGKVSFLSDVTIVAPTIGGEIGTYNEFTVSMGSTKPVQVRAA